MVTEHDEKIAVRMAVLERDHDDLKTVVVEIRNSLQSFSTSLQALVRLEENHGETSRALARAFDAIEKVEKRTAGIEQKMPGLLEMRSLIVGAICVVLMAVGAAVLAMIGLSKGV